MKLFDFVKSELTSDGAATRAATLSELRGTLEKQVDNVDDNNVDGDDGDDDALR